MFESKQVKILCLYILDLVLDSSNREEVHLFDNINMCVSVCWLAQFTKPTKHKVGRGKEGENCYVKE